MLKKTNHKKRVAILKLSKIVHLLGKILGLVIKEQEGISLFSKIEKIRILSKASRGKKNMQKIKQLVNKIEQEKDTFSKIALIKQLDDEVSKVRKELITQFQKENR